MNPKRNFIPEKQEINSWADVEPFLEDLKNREIKSASDLLKWWHDRSETEAFLEENAAWRYIKMSCDTENKSLSESFNFFVGEIEPKAAEYSDILDKKLVSSPFLNDLDSEKYFVPIRSRKRQIELFRKENIPIFAELQKREQEYGSIAGAMTVTFHGEEMTLAKAGNLLKDTDRQVRKEIFELINNRRLQDSEKLNDLMSNLIEMRRQIAANAGFENYRDYKHQALNRFDYTTEDCFRFHESVKKCVVPMNTEILKHRLKTLGYDSLKPYDTDVDENLLPPVKAFETGAELLAKTIAVFDKIKPMYGDFLRKMRDGGFLDLDSRKGKAPGGYNYPLYESNIPFIFTNATGNLRDAETLMHEGGHAVHSFLSGNLELVDFKNLPSEVAELASMSMELIAIENMQSFFDSDDDYRRAKKHQLEGILNTLPWIATVDKFQHLLYLNPKHTAEERKKMWLETAEEFNAGITDWNGYENFYANTWQKQLHIFEIPFYYIEYGFAQLGAIAVWRNYKKNPAKALTDYENALKLGYSVPIPEIYKTAGIEFNFSMEYIAELTEFVKAELLMC
jgi:oligoendopeptidase F